MLFPNQFLNRARTLLLLAYFVLCFESCEPSTPLLKIHPEPKPEHTSSKLIYYTSYRPETSKYYIDSLNKFLEQYTKPPVFYQNIYNCDYNFQPVTPNAYCDFDVKSLGSCSYEPEFGFSRSNPCIFLTLSEIEGWKPLSLSKTSLEDIGNQTYSYHLKEIVDNLQDEERSGFWVSCQGENAADIENIGSLEYYPHPFFPAYYFQFANSNGYQPPVVAVKFLRPANGIVITVECKVWAKSITLDSAQAIAVTTFYLLID